MIIVDDGGIDNTDGVIKNIADNRIQYHKQINRGVSAARNTGASVAKGKYLIFLDSDDYLSKGYLFALHKALEHSPYAICFGVAWFLDTDKKLIKKIEAFYKLNNFGPMLSGAYAISRETFLFIGGFDGNLSYSENSDLFFRLRAHLSPQTIGQVSNEGVNIQTIAPQERAIKYSEKKFKSVKYFLEKHKSVFDRSTREFLNFKRIQALCAFQNNEMEEARKCMREAIVRDPWSIKSYLQFILLLFPTLARYYYLKRLE